MVAKFYINLFTNHNKLGLLWLLIANYQIREHVVGIYYK